jgi:hypothetical protein
MKPSTASPDWATFQGEKGKSVNARLRSLNPYTFMDLCSMQVRNANQSNFGRSRQRLLRLDPSRGQVEKIWSAWKVIK